MTAVFASRQALDQETTGFLESPGCSSQLADAP
jgi:hypothetical protein